MYRWSYSKLRDYDQDPCSQAILVLPLIITDRPARRTKGRIAPLAAQPSQHFQVLFHLRAMESLLLTLEKQAQRLVSTLSIADDLILSNLLYFPFRDRRSASGFYLSGWLYFLDETLESLPGCDASINCTNEGDRALEVLRQIDPFLQTSCGWPS
jgi:hypothetical protein